MVSQMGSELGAMTSAGGGRSAKFRQGLGSYWVTVDVHEGLRGLLELRFGRGGLSAFKAKEAQPDASMKLTGAVSPSCRQSM